MQRSAIAFTGYLSLAAALMGACGPEPLEPPDPETPPNTGGTGGTGGNGGTGGTGGSTTGGTGGSVTGGTGGVGGAVGGAGGAVAGASGKGGVGGAAGSTGGALSGAGGSVAGAGGAAAGSAGAGAGTAGTGAAGGPAVECPAAFAVGADGFVRAPAAGGACWHGYASAGKGAMDMTSVIMPTSFAACGPSCMLRLSGTLGAATEANGYSGVVFFGFNVNQAAGSATKATVTPTGTGLTATFTNTGASPIVRVQISAGSADATRWCANAVSGTAIPYAMFNTTCWAPTTGTAYAMQPIDTVQIVLPGGEADAPFDITLLSIKDG
jgi:hypothetical protein